MGLEEHLIGMFRHDFEFVDGHRSHLGDGAPSVSPVADAVHEGAVMASGPTPTAVAVVEAPVAVAEAPAAVAGPSATPVWTADGEAELHKIPFFVRGKVRRNTETFARERGLGEISAETLYDAKAHFSR
jgi:light-independent protochlorophyllide reductase subunit B